MNKISFENDKTKLNEKTMNTFQENIEKAIDEKLNKTGGTINGDVSFEGRTHMHIGPEIWSMTPFIDFHFENSEDDYTHRIIANDEKFLDFSTAIRFIGALSSLATPDKIHIVNSDNSGYMPVQASAFSQQSSRRYKENIKDMTEDEANKILKVDVVTFDYKENSMMKGQNVAGAIAEDVYEILPDVVTMTEIDGKKVPDSIDYSKFIPYLIKMVQMLEKKVAELEVANG